MVNVRRQAGGRRQAGAGFTLPEVLLAGTVLAFASASLLQAIVAGQMQTYHALHQTRAASLNDAMLDELLSLPYGELPAWHGHSQPVGELTDALGEPYDAPYQRFEREVSVVDHTQSPPGLGELNGRLITVTVRDAQAGTWTVQRFVRPPATATGPTGGGAGEGDGNGNGNGGGNGGNGNGNGNGGNGNGNGNSNGNGNGNGGGNGNGKGKNN